MELSDDVKFVEEFGDDPREVLYLWLEVAGKKAVEGRLMSMVDLDRIQLGLCVPLE